MAQGLTAFQGIAINPDEVETNLVFFDLTPEAPMTAPQLLKRLQEAGVRMSAMGRTRIRAITHLDIA